MSDVLNAAVPAPEASAPAAPQPAPAAPSTASDARATLGRVITAPPAPAESAPAVDTPTPAEPAAAQQDAAEPAAGPARDPETGRFTSPAATEEVPAGFVRIELPEAHPLRDRGRDYVLAPEGQEAEYRNLVNTPVRRAELEAATQRAEALEQQMIQYQATLQARNEFLQQVLTDPTLAQRLAEVREVYGEDAAQDFLNGILARQDGSIKERVEQLAQAAEAQRTAQAAQQFFTDVTAQASSLFPHWSAGEVQEALYAFGSFCEAKNVPSATLQDFVEFANPYYIRHPRVQEEVRGYLSRQEQEQAAKQQALEEQAQRLAGNPMGRIPVAAVHAGATAPVTAPRAANAAEARKNLGRSAVGAL